jgi:monomeric sarcosine oxidase
MPSQGSYDAIVLGCGAMGSAACYNLARRGLKVLGLEQFEPGHDQGSSHGESRLIRRAYFEHPAYVPLLNRSYELWRELEVESGQRLLNLNGLIIYGPPAGGTVLAGVRKSGELHGVPLVHLDGDGARRAYASYVPPPGHVASLEPGAGYVPVEEAVRTQAALARRYGAEIHGREPVTQVHVKTDSVEVETGQARYRANRLVVTAGAWSSRFLPKLAPQLQVRRVLLFWYPNPAGWADARSLPCFGFELEDGFYYGVPAVSGKGVKVGHHVPGEPVADPSALRRDVTDTDLAAVRAFVRRCLPELGDRPHHHAVCMYTMTPDEHFIVDREGPVVFAAGFSGHGFKFTPVIGEILGDLATAGRTELPADFLRYRWEKGGAP